MTATVLRFPILRRCGFIEKQAAHAACMNPDASVRHVEYRIQVQRDAMRRRSVAGNIIARKLKFLDAAIRRALLQAQLTGGA